MSTIPGQSPTTLDDLRAVEGEERRFEAAQAYLARVDDCATAARLVRDEAIRALVAQHGRSKTARLTGLHLSTIKGVSWGVRGPQ